MNDSAAILSRAIRADNWRLTPAAAQSILQIRLTTDDKVHMRELAARARTNEMTEAEELELQEYQKSCCLIEMLRVAAHKCLLDDRSRTPQRPQSSTNPIHLQTREDWDKLLIKAYGAEWVDAHKTFLDEQWTIVENF